MTEQEARRLAEGQRAPARIDAGWRVTAAERRFILLAGEDREQPGPVRDALVWIVRFGGGLSWAELALDDRSGALLRVERSR